MTIHSLLITLKINNYGNYFMYNKCETGDSHISSFYDQSKLKNMSCCGNKRNAWQRTESQHSHKIETPAEVKRMLEDIYFEYTGATALTVTGSVSGKKYRFLFTGDRQMIDYRDASGMIGVPVLRRVKT
jgi:hypothetical protein